VAVNLLLGGVRLLSVPVFQVIAYGSSFAHWMGIVPMKMELDKIRSEARRLRFVHRMNARVPGTSESK
jgi:hypothetical protein